MNKRKNTKKVSTEKTDSKNIALKAFRVTQYSSLILVIAFALGSIAYYGTNVVSNAVSRPIASVLVKGSLQYLEQEAVIELLSDNINKSFLSENLSLMRKNVELNPW
ncbi:MAG: FtsQ-type POTRA domain-containing protein, partial [Pseudomonadota bacterium]